MTIQAINIGAVANDGNGDAPRQAGEKINANFSDADNAASRLVGTAIGNIPDADDLSMVGASVNYTGNNLNPNSFGGTTGSIAIAIGYAQTTTVINFFAPISGTANPVSATVAGTFTVQDLQFSTVASAVSPTLNSASGNKLAILTVSGLAGLTVDKAYYLRTDSAGSKITVNF